MTVEEQAAADKAAAEKKSLEEKAAADKLAAENKKLADEAAAKAADPIAKMDAHYKEVLAHKEVALQALKKEKEDLKAKLEQSGSLEDKERLNQLTEEITSLKDQLTQGITLAKSELTKQTLLEKKFPKVEERTLIETILKNRIIPSGNLENDVEEARLLANRETFTRLEKAQVEQHQREAASAASMAAMGGMGGDYGGGGGGSIDPRLAAVMKAIDPHLAERTIQRLQKG